jgi:hypothetical protein
MANNILSNPEDPSWKDNFNTPIPADRQKEFQKWLTPKRSRDMQSYDMQGFFLSGQGQAPNGHYTDEFKKPNHITFSNESKYHQPGVYEGGSWGQNGLGGWEFNASPHNVTMHSEEGLQDYFNTKEKASVLNMPNPAELFYKYIEEALKGGR